MFDMGIENDAQYRQYKENVEVVIKKGTALGDINLLSDDDKKEFVRLTDAIYEWEAIHHPLPGRRRLLQSEILKFHIKPYPFLGKAFLSFISTS